jgi:uncharacterized protein (DUF2384 family)
MAFDYTYDADNHVIVLTGTSSVTIDDRTKCVSRMVEDRALPDIAAVLIDVCHAENSPSNDEILMMSRLVERMQARFHSRIAILNTSVGHLTLSHLVALSAVACDRAVQVFTSEKEARAWLRHPPLTTS